MKAILISIQPKWVAKILNGEKTIEVRKRFPLNYRGWVYIYVTKGRNLVYGDTYRNGSFVEEYAITSGYSKEEANKIFGLLNGKVVARFYCDNVEELISHTPNFIGDIQLFKGIDNKEILANSCLTIEELEKYLNIEFCNVLYGYAIHISQLEIFDKPNELSEFKHWKKEYNPYGEVRDYYGEIYSYCLLPLTKDPQNFCYVEVEE